MDDLFLLTVFLAGFLLALGVSAAIFDFLSTK